MSSLEEKAKRWPEYAVFYELAPYTAVVAALVLIISLTVFIWAARGLYISRKAVNTTPNADNATHPTESSTVPSSRRLENLSFAVMVCFTLSCIAFLPASLRSAYLPRSMGYTPAAIVYFFWGIGYMMMFRVFIRRLKEISTLSSMHRNVLTVLLIAFALCFVAYMVVEFGGFRDVHSAKVLVLVVGIASYIGFAVMIMVLFSRQLFQQMKVESDPNGETLQNPELLELVTRYTVLGFVGIFTSVCVTMTWAVYYAYLAGYDGPMSFIDVWTMWILPMDEIVNMICIALYLPFATGAYDRICCLTHSICKSQCKRILVNDKTGNVDRAEQTQNV